MGSLCIDDVLRLVATLGAGSAGQIASNRGWAILALVSAPTPLASSSQRATT